MRNVNRRTALLGAAVLAGAAGPVLSGAAPAHAAPELSDADLTLLRRSFTLAEQARAAGGSPYGAVVADADGNVIAENGNTSEITGGDPTQHAELVATTAAWRALGYDGMNLATLYASTEPCTMCAGAAYWNGIGRVVYGLPNYRLFEFTGDDPAQTGFALPSRDVLLHGARPITVIGPMLPDEAARAHQGYWS